MIIELQNFGPIKSFKFDTSKDMHAIFGKNNIGKSYAISAVYLILKNLREYKEDMMFWDKINLMDDKLQSISFQIVEIQNKRLDKLNVTKEIERLILDSLNSSFIKSLESSFRNSYNYANIQNKFTPSSVKIVMFFDSLSVEFGIRETDNKIFIDKVLYKNENHFYLDKDLNINLNTEKYSLETLANSISPSSPITDKLIRVCITDFQIDLEIGLSEQLYFLPSSRSGLYNALSSFGAIFAELSRNRSHITRKIEIPNMTEPISDYFLNLNTIDKAQANEHYLKHFEEIEQKILKGKITLDNDSKKYYYVPNDTDMRLELSFTSSMISEIAPIIAHLKYIIPLESDKPSILFIEEPEAHLHPEIQILLIEYFVKLSKGNVKIVMTSHSNYIFNKLSNLLIAKEIDSEKLSVMLMKMTPEGSVVEDNAMQIDEYGIEDNNFVDVAEQLYEERMALLEKL